MTDTEQDTFIRNLSISSKNNSFAKRLAEIIKCKFKQEDLQLQVMWVTDITRLTFLVRICTSSGLMWVRDKKGKKVIEKIVEPYLDRIAELTNKHIEDLKDFESNNLEEIENMEYHRFNALDLKAVLDKNKKDNIISGQVAKGFAHFFQYIGKDLEEYANKHMKKVKSKSSSDSESSDNSESESSSNSDSESENDAKKKYNNKIIKSKGKSKSKSDNVSCSNSDRHIINNKKTTKSKKMAKRKPESDYDSDNDSSDNELQKF